LRFPGASKPQTRTLKGKYRLSDVVRVVLGQDLSNPAIKNYPEKFQAQDQLNETI
jgi:hypothetical protein